MNSAQQRWSRGHNARGQGQECSRPRPRTKDTSASVLRKKRSSEKIFRRSPNKKKKVFRKFFRQSPQKTVFQKIFQALHKVLITQKILLSSSRGQDNFRELEASRPRTSKCALEDVLEAKDVLEDSISGAQYDLIINRKHIIFFFSVLIRFVTEPTNFFVRFCS